MWSNLKVRVISALIGAVFILGVIFSVPVVFHVAVVATCFFILYELYVTFKQETKWQVVLLNYVFAMALLFLPLIGSAVRGQLLSFLLVLYLMLLFICAVIWHDSIKFSNVTISFFMLVYAVVFPMHLTYIRMMEHGVALIFLPFLGAWVPDIFAYFSGKLFGKHKLIP
ncbi:MAG: phosphatidate cytidylyltransferase, partial [Clostridia bacterium]|nr:phosphatidate cytidylyltransferase [Clostridia bacterium]